MPICCCTLATQVLLGYKCWSCAANEAKRLFVTLPPEFGEAVRAFQQGRLDLALDLANRFVAAAGATPQSDHLLGLIHCRLGYFHTGVALLRRSLAADPANLSYRLMLARARIDAGEPAAAATVAEDGPGAGPAHLAFLQVAAEAAEKMGDAGRAESVNRKIAAAQPEDWRAWNNLATALAAQENWAEAADALERALALNSDPSLRRQLAAALHGAGRTREAAAQLQMLLEQRPDEVEPRIALGRHLMALGDVEQAERLLRSAVALAPASVDAVQELGFALERMNRMEALAALIEDASRAGVADPDLAYLRAALVFRAGDPAAARQWLSLAEAPADAARWYRLLARIEDTLDAPREAFAAVVAMNRATVGRDKWQASGATYRRNLRGLAPVITPKWTASIPRLPPGPRPAPVFLVGFPRSGTTLLDTFLMGHPDVRVLEEVHMLGAAELVVGK
ncbi:MAG: tetratricopeptide repeat protein, partial [Hyphomicrobium sp.]|nr:tetratricopeptide repeat protein [Hyphomicrobium sp.]